jgi:hypothetical protein
MSGNELPKVIDKSQADIDAAIAAIKASDIPNGTKGVCRLLYPPCCLVT